MPNIKQRDVSNEVLPSDMSVSSSSIPTGIIVIVLVLATLLAVVSIFFGCRYINKQQNEDDDKVDDDLSGEYITDKDLAAGDDDDNIIAPRVDVA